MFLRDEQNAFLSALERRSPEIATIYYGGLRALADEQNPYRVPLAAHSFREMIAHLVTLTGESVVFGEGRKNQAYPVKEEFSKWRNSRLLPNGQLDTAGGMPESLVLLISEYFLQEEQNGPTFRRKMAMLLTQLAGPVAALPSDVVSQELTQWIEVDRFFKLVAHGKHKATVEVLVRNLFVVEDILLKRLKPRPVSDLNEIDELLAEDDDAE